jgi:hypothetical protein
MTGVTLAGAAGTWLLADMMGMAIVAPFALSLTSVFRDAWLKALTAPMVICARLVSCCAGKTEVPVHLPGLSAWWPWAVINDRDRGGALGVGAVAFAVIAAALLDQGPIARLPQFGVSPRYR